MTLPTSGPIAMGQISEELSQPYDSARGLGDATTRVLLQKPTGAISLSDGYGKEAVFVFSIAARTTAANLRALAVAAGWNQTDRLVATVTGNISSHSPLYPALTIDGSFQKGVTLNINSGVFVVGRGGQGGAAATYQVSASPGGTGGDALAVFSPVTINNLGTIGGGGGGGGGAAMVEVWGNDPNIKYYWTGGGGGGGASYAGGGAGAKAYGSESLDAGDGAAGSFVTGGLGGSANTTNVPNGLWGGSGGSLGNNGTSGGTGYVVGFAGKRRFFVHAPGGAAGACVTGNSFITWVATGSRLGAIYGNTYY